MSNATPTIDDRFQDAVSAYERGDLSAASSLGEALITDAPEFADAKNLMSAIAQDRDQLAEAEQYARSALTVDPTNPVYHNTLGNTLRRLGRTDEAIQAFVLARRGMPDQPDILFNLGNALRDAGRFDEAVDAFRTSALLKPGVVAVYNNLAITLKSMGDPEGAATVLIEGLAYAPKSPELRFNLGNALQAAGRADAAESSYRRAVDLRPGHAEAWVNLGVVLAAQGKKAEAEAAFKHAIGLDKDLSQAYVGLADLADQGSLDAVSHRRQVLDMRPDLAAIRSSLLMSLHYSAKSTPEDLTKEHITFGERHNNPQAQFAREGYDVTPTRRLKLGVVSGDFRFHAMLFFALPVLAARDHQDWTLYCYSNTALPDRHTQSFRQTADHWRDVKGLSDQALSTLIAEDEIDVLIDLSGHAPHNRLRVFADKRAPLQVAWGDYVDTRGMDAIDILIGDPVHTPLSEQSRYVETLVQLSADYICYQPPAYLPPATLAPFDKSGCVTFGTFSELTIIQPETMALWAAVLKAVPDSRFFANSYLLANEGRQGQLYSAFMENGISTDRIMIGTGGEHADFLDQYSKVDIILDTWPYSGGLTTCEALCMGVPVVTLKGDRFCGRHAAAHLGAAGFPQWVAETKDDFVAIATDLAATAAQFSTLRRQIRQKTLASPLCDVPQFSAAFYDVLRAEWQAKVTAG